VSQRTVSVSGSDSSEFRIIPVLEVDVESRLVEVTEQYDVPPNLISSYSFFEPNN
jgi:hypothetical protein